MREPPPAQLASLLERLGLANDRDLENVQSAVHRMSGDLPQFESVWIDALRKARILTHFQAAELHAGRGEALKIARYVLCQSVQECGYATVYRAEDCETREAVRLAVFSPPSQDRDLLLPSLEKLISSGKGLPRSTGKIEACGLDGSRHWAASPWVEGTSLADSLLHHGRFPPPVVLEIARAMLGELATLEAASVIHGDVRVQNVLIANDGEVHTPHPGLRGIIRPHEGISHHDLLPDACSGLAPERVTDGTLPTVASDFFACGCVWWHMLCGRPPLGGGDSLARLRAAQAASIDDLQQWAADVPDVLVEAIRDCLQTDPQKRPKSMAGLAQRLGPLRRQGRQAIARCLVAAARPHAPWLRSKRTPGKKKSHPHRFTAAALAILAAVAVAWPLWVAHNRPLAKVEIASHLGSPIAKPQEGHTNDSAGKAPSELAPRPMVDTAVTPAGYADSIGAPRATAKNTRDDSAAGRIAKPSLRTTGRTSLAHGSPGSRRVAPAKTRIVGPRARRTGPNRRSSRWARGSGRSGLV